MTGGILRGSGEHFEVASGDQIRDVDMAGLDRAIAFDPATRLLRASVPLPTISAVLGHSSEDSTSVYMNADRDRLLQCVLPVPAGARR